MRRSLVAVACFALVGCGRKVPVPPAGEEAGAAAPSASVASYPPRCSELTPGASFTIGERGPAPKAVAGEDPHEDDDLAPRPFAVELGSATAYGAGFAVGASRVQQGGQRALIALVPRDAGSGRLLELGAVHGTAEPPRVAGRGEQLVAVVPDSDAGGGTLRLATIRDVAGHADVVWGAEHSVGRDDSEAFDVDIGASRAVVVWDRYDKARRASGIELSTFDPAVPSTATPARLVSGRDADAEGPRVVRRPGGFWLAWVTRTPQPRTLPRRAPAGASASPPDDPPEPVQDGGPRGLVLVPLDENGSPTAAPLSVAPRDAHVVVYDLATAPGGEAWLVWRDDAGGVGVENPSATLARVGLDGTVSKSRIEDADLDVGGPTLLTLETESGGQYGWLALDAAAEATKLGALGDNLQVLDSLAPEAWLAGATALARSGDALLVARPRGLAIELGALRCQRGAFVPAPVVAAAPGAPAAPAPSAEPGR